MQEDFETPVINAPIILYDYAVELIPLNSIKLNPGDFILHKDTPYKITENLPDSVKAIVWSDAHTIEKLPVVIVKETEPLISLMRVTLNICLSDDSNDFSISRQCYLDINEGISKNLKRIKDCLKEIHPVFIEVHEGDTNLSTIKDGDKMYFQDSFFKTDMELDVMCITRDDIKTVRLFNDVAFKPQGFVWNCFQC